MRFVGLLGILFGAYSLFEWGVLGHSPWTLGMAAGLGSNFGGGTATSGGTSGGGGGWRSILSSRFAGSTSLIPSSGLTVSGIPAYDQAGLTAFGGGTLAQDLDYPLSAGTPITLPGAGLSHATFTYLGDNQGGWGHLLGFRINDPGMPWDKAVIEFLHFSQVARLQVGQSYGAGSYVGQSGGRPGIDVPNSAFSTGAHLAVVIDQRALAFLQSLAGTVG